MNPCKKTFVKILPASILIQHIHTLVGCELCLAVMKMKIRVHLNIYLFSFFKVHLCIKSEITLPSTKCAYKIGPSGVRALHLGVAAERSFHYIWYYCSFFSSFCATYFSPRRGCPRVMKFCMEFWVTKNINYFFSTSSPSTTWLNSPTCWILVFPWFKL